MALNNVSSSILFLDKITFHPIMLLIVIRPENKILAFLAKAGENPIFFQLFQPNYEKRLIFQIFQSE